MPYDFEDLEQVFRSGGAAALFAALVKASKAEKDYRLLFQVRLMEARREAGLPLMDAAPSKDRIEAAAREAGELFLADADIPSAWPFFKAIGDPAPVTAAIEHIESDEQMDRIIEIAFHEGACQRKGFELILRYHGVCRAITLFSTIRDPQIRQPCLALLIRRLYDDLVRAVREAAGSNEESLAGLIAGRDWLFEGPTQYVDSTHLAALLRYAPELEDQHALALAAEMADYGDRLNPMFHFRGDPPFEDTYRDHAIYLRALLGQDVDRAICHFRAKLNQHDTTPAEVLIDLLARLNRYTDAINVALEYMPDSAPGLCQMSGDYGRLRQIGIERGDVLAFTAGLVAD